MRRKRQGREGGRAQAGNNRHGYCKIYCFSSFRLIVMLDEKRTIREAYGRGGGLARFPSELTSALSFPSSLSPREIVIVRLDSPASLYPRLFRNNVTDYVFLDRRRCDSSSDCPNELRLQKWNNQCRSVGCKWKSYVISSTESSLGDV